ncbi:MAG: sulfur carrier protein ThiS [Parvularculaceae bacterium]|nr:sulfur carrier protein ThiS [Parvularculaceae bacterium]
MELKINGENMRFDRPMTVGELIVALGLEPRKLAIERNLEIIPKSAYGQISLADGDRLEIVHFVGGG